MYGSFFIFVALESVRHDSSDVTPVGEKTTNQDVIGEFWSDHFIMIDDWWLRMMDD